MPEKRGTVTYMMSSNMSGLFCSRTSMRSFMAMMMFDVLSSVPCFELFSAAPVQRHQFLYALNPLETFPRNFLPVTFPCNFFVDGEVANLLRAC